jgi:acyl-coenzyme A synthetase/AMP-(fatty) acid ligase
MSTTVRPASYEQARGDHRLEVPAVFNAPRDIVDERAAATPEAVATVAVDLAGDVRRLSFRDVSLASNRAANLLASLGVGAGDRIFVMLPRVPAWHEVILGAGKLGAVAMPGTTLLTAHDIAYRVQQAEATVAVTDAEGAARVAEAAGSCPSLRTLVTIDPERPDGSWVDWRAGIEAASEAAPDAAPTRAEDPLLLYFTSGTTGMPKMVLHTHASYGIGHEITARYWMDLGPGDVHWTYSDTGWAKAAWGMLYGQWRMGAAVVLADMRGRPDLDRILRAIGSLGVTTFCAPPTMFRALVLGDLAGADLGPLRHVVSAGEPMDPETIERWKAGTGLDVYDGYGQTETVNLVANYPFMPIREGSMGRPTPGFDVAVVDEEGRRLPPGEEGHVGVAVQPERPIGLFGEYWRNPEATAAVFRDGWYLTGDRARVDEDGYLWFVGRADDVITSSAYRIGPFEVESALVSHPAVAEAAVVGVPDELRGEIVKAFVVLAPGVDGSPELVRELQVHCKRVTAPYKYPREIEFTPELPKTVSGKIRRVELRERERSRMVTSEADPAG